MKDCNKSSDCSGRREFLVKTAGLAGGFVLTLSGIGSALGRSFADVTVNIDSSSPLNKVGGSVIVDSSAGKIIIARTGEATYIAYSAKCTHKGGIVEYDAAGKQFVCPKHGSKFDSATGNVTAGPADSKLPSFPANGTASTVTVTVA
ncbi:MAG: Rieske (2Fe-2S) protein [Pyrinomonadaceae bacterium]